MSDIQKLLFQQIKTKIPLNLSMVDTISELLNLSYDSTYRRIRGEKSLSIEELKILSSHFGISLDKLFNIEASNIIFSTNDFNHLHFTFQDYLNFILNDLSKFKSGKTVELIYSAKDVPIFHHFSHPELAAFKIFFWLKSILQFPEYSNKKFSLAENLEVTMRIGEKIARVYEGINSKEIWDGETIIGMLRQIDYSYELGVFESRDEAILLCDKLDDEIDHIKAQAEIGCKFLDKEQIRYEKGNYEFYLSEVIPADNTILVNIDETQVTYITFNVLSLLTTSDELFCKSTEKHLRNIISKSALISSISERERTRFFNNMHQKVDRLRQKIKQDTPDYSI